MENQVELMGYVTKNFDICGRAVSAFSELKAAVPDMSKQSREDLLGALKYQDAMFGIEKALYEIGSTEVDMAQVEEAVMLSHMVTYAIGMVSAEMDIEVIDMFAYLPMHIEQIRHPYKKINPALPDRVTNEEKTMKEATIKEYGEGRMARASLRKIIYYAGEMLSMVNPEDELESWVQGKIAEMDHSIESVYTYYKFGERYEPKPQEVHAEENNSSDEAPLPPTAQSVQHICALSVQHEKMGFGMCIPTTHSLNEKGEVEFYDVVFSNGIAKGIPAKDLKILESKSHMHDY